MMIMMTIRSSSSLHSLYGGLVRWCGGGAADVAMSITRRRSSSRGGWWWLYLCWCTKKFRSVRNVPFVLKERWFAECQCEWQSIENLTNSKCLKCLSTRSYSNRINIIYTYHLFALPKLPSIVWCVYDIVEEEQIEKRIRRGCGNRRNLTLLTVNSIS